MPRGASTTVENQFVKGLITEQSAMNFPEQAVTEADNCVFSELGPVRRRLGMDFENGYVVRNLTSVTTTPEAKTEFKWYSAGNVSTITFLVQQFGNILRFFSISSNSSVSGGLKPFSVNLNSFAVPGVTQFQISLQTCQFSYGKGYLFVTHPLCNPFYVIYNSVTDTISTNQITIEIRDFDGVDDGLPTDARPLTLSNLHYYNLLNQGWGASTQAEDMGTIIALSYWDLRREDYPSNADIFWLYRRADGPIDRINIDAKYPGNTPAPKGHFIYNALNIDRTATSGIAGLPGETSGLARPTVTAFYAGRVFYAGIGANKYSNRLYFSQILESDRQIGRCYQHNDPTSEVAFDLLDSDGGVIDLPLIERVIAMKVIENSLIILATNGIITINGSTTGPFRATNYEVNYVSTIGTSSAISIIEVDGGLMFWNNEVLYALVRDNVSSSFQVQNISKSTIQSILNEIPIGNLPYIKGAYNKKDQIIQWVYSDQESVPGFLYNRILEFNVVSKAFYTHTINTQDGNFLSGIVTLAGQGVRQTVENVTDNLLELVTDISGQAVQIEASQFVPNSEVFKYLTTGPFGAGGALAYTYSGLIDIQFVDWRASTGSGRSYRSYGISGYRVRGAFQQSSQSSPVVFVVKYFDDGSLRVSGIWDYNFRESTQEELYLIRPEVDYLVRRVKIRGKGKSFQIKFESVGNAPFELLGWSTYDSGGTIP